MQAEKDRAVPPPVDDVALVARAQRGEADAHRALFRGHVTRVHRLMYRLLGPSADVEDAVQVTFGEAFRGLSGFKGEALFSTWLARIAVRVARRHRVSLRNWRLRTLLVDHGADADSLVDRQASARESLRRLDAVLASLRPKPRAAFVLHVLEGLSVAEIAVIEEASVGAIKVRVHDARQKIEKAARKDPWLKEWLSEGETP